MASNYIVSARKYRPATWNSVVGQENLTQTLKSAIDSKKLAQAYLFCGPRGVGKTTCARIFAKTINCMNPTPDGEACNECESCRAFIEQRSYNITELDAASNNSVEDIRNINDQVRIPPQTGHYRVFIIDEVHMLSTAAFNAFLKTLEEPPSYAIFILATTEKQKVLPTILSRCQIYDFARITVPDIVKQLQFICQEENIEAEPAALNVIAQKADGAMRDALSIFDQVTASSGGHITYRSPIDNLNVLDYDYYFKLVESFMAGDVPQALLIYKDIREKGFDSQFFINGLQQHLRDLMVASTPQTHTLLEMNEEVAQMYVSQAARLSPKFMYLGIELCNTCDLNYRNASCKQLLVELTLIKLCQIMNPAPTGTTNETPPVKKIPPTSPAQPQQPTAAPPKPVQQTTAPAAPVKQTPVQQAQAPVADDETPPPPPVPDAPMPAPRPQQTSPLASKRILVNNKTAMSQAKPVNEAQTIQQSRNQDFTNEQLIAAWDQFIKDHPHAQALISTMRSSKPELQSGTSYIVKVQSPSQVEFINENKTELMQSLRDALSNDLVEITPVVDESAPAPKIWTPREIAEDLKQKNPLFEQFVKDYQLTLV